MNEKHLKKTRKKLKKVIEFTEFLIEEEPYAEKAFDYIFPAFRKIESMVLVYCSYIDYYDPDTSYLEDVLAKLYQLREYYRDIDSAYKELKKKKWKKQSKNL